MYKLSKKSVQIIHIINIQIRMISTEIPVPPIWNSGLWRDYTITDLLKDRKKQNLKGPTTKTTAITSMRHNRRIFSLSWFSLFKRSGWVLHWGFIVSNLLILPWLKARSRSSSHSDWELFNDSRMGWASWKRGWITFEYNLNSISGLYKGLYTRVDIVQLAVLKVIKSILQNQPFKSIWNWI